jgi:DNA polymerase-3 subunit beta
MALDVTVARKPLAEAIGLARKVGATVDGVPILAHLLFESRAGALSVTGSDAVAWLTFTLPATVAREGAATGPADILSAMVGRLAADDLRMHTARTPLMVEAGRFRAALNALDPEAFPAPPESATSAPGWRMTVRGAALARLLGVGFAAGNGKETRPALRGVNLHVYGGRLVAVATDGMKLAQLAGDAPEDAEGDSRALIDAGIARLLAALAGRASDARVVLSGDRRRFRAQGADWTLAAPLIDLDYPDFRRVLPGDGALAVGVARADFAALVARAAISGATGGMRIDLAPGLMTLSMTGDATVASGRSGRTTAAAVSHIEAAVDYAGPSRAVGIDPRHLLPIVEHMEGERVALTLRQAHEPITLAPAELAESDRALSLVMPMWLGHD